MKLNLGLEGLNVTSEKQNSISINSKELVLGLINEMYCAFGDTHKDQLDNLVASVCGYEVSELKNVSSENMSEAIMNQLSTISTEGFIRNAWAGLVYKFAKTQKKIRVLQSAIKTLNGMTDEEFDQKTIKVNVVKYQDLNKAFTDVESVYKQITAINLRDVKQDGTGEDNKVKFKNKVNAAIEKLNSIKEDISTVSDKVNAYKKYDVSAKEYGYTRSNTIAIFEKMLNMHVEFFKKLNIRLDSINTQINNEEEQKNTANVKSASNGIFYAMVAMFGFDKVEYRDNQGDAQVNVIYQQLYKAMQSVLVSMVGAFDALDKLSFVLAYHLK